VLHEWKASQELPIGPPVHLYEHPKRCTASAAPGAFFRFTDWLPATHSQSSSMGRPSMSVSPSGPPGRSKRWPSLMRRWLAEPWLSRISRSSLAHSIRIPVRRFPAGSSLSLPLAPCCALQVWRAGHKPFPGTGERPPGPALKAWGVQLGLVARHDGTSHGPGAWGSVAVEPWRTGGRETGAPI
jgi:hypothetical protein